LLDGEGLGWFFLSELHPASTVASTRIADTISSVVFLAFVMLVLPLS